MVECDLAKVEVAGSNPVSRSRFLWFPAGQKLRDAPARNAVELSRGAVPKW